MTNAIAWYINSNVYQRDLQATRHLWMRQGILGKAGMFIFLSYITIPLLLRVQPLEGLARSATIKLGLLREQEKHFWQRVLGLTDEANWEGGIANFKIRNMLSGLQQRHFRFAGMRQEYINFFAAIIALSPGRIYTNTNTPVDTWIQTAYWRYMTYTWEMLGVTLDTETTASQRCQDFIGLYTQPGTEGKRMFQTLQEIYPTYLQQAIPALFPVTRLAIQRFQEDT